MKTIKCDLKDAPKSVKKWSNVVAGSTCRVEEELIFIQNIETIITSRTTQTLLTERRRNGMEQSRMATSLMLSNKKSERCGQKKENRNNHWRQPLAGICE
jgi:hypothetical protein